MRMLLSDGTGLTARQSATLLGQAGHHVEVLSPDPMSLCRFTRHVRRIHQVPAYGSDPLGWLDAALATARRRRIDVLVPTQEQVAVMSWGAERIRRSGLATAVPPFASLTQVQDKLAAFATLARLGLPQPPATVVTSERELEAYERLPVYVKAPIGTASTGVHRVVSRGQLRRLAARYGQDRTFAEGGVLAQQPVAGPLAMVQSVFARGQMIAFHACERIREGAGGGASHKRGIALPDVREHLAALGGDLGWHGALSADVILSSAGPRFIDLNPRLVEPVNACRSGVDLLRALVETALTGSAEPQADGRPGAQTHQLVLAVLAAAQREGGRRRVIGELRGAITHRGGYHNSTEELTPLRKDLLAATPVALAVLATLIQPRASHWLLSGSVEAYRLTPGGWRQITGRPQPGAEPCR